METYSLQNDLKVFGLQVKTFPQGIGETFNSLTKTLPKAFTRSYYGISEMTGEGMIYLATSTELYEGEADNYHFHRYIVPKGKYLATIVKDWRNKIPTLKTVFNQMMQDDRVDKQKPCIEWYKDEDEMWCMVKADIRKELLSESQLV